MTIEEAIKVLRTESVELGGNAVSVCRFLEALDMAIAALRQQDHFRDVTKKVEPLTNAQKIRAMSDEELATFISEIADECERNTECNQQCYGCDIEYCVRESCLKWLQQPAEEAGHER